MIQKDLNTLNVTPRNMRQIFQEVEEKQKIISICKDFGLNIDLLSEFFKYRAQGLQAVEVAQKLGVHRVTVSRYLKSLRNITDSDFNFLYNYIKKRENEKNN